MIFWEYVCSAEKNDYYTRNSSLEDICIQDDITKLFHKQRMEEQTQQREHFYYIFCATLL